MKAKLIVEGKEFDIEILDPKLQELIAPTKKTGYERGDYNELYYIENIGGVQGFSDWGKNVDEMAYASANYYSDKTVAENNARADKLMRQLRRFAVEHREKKFNWDDYIFPKYYIGYCYDHSTLTIECCFDNLMNKTFGVIYFDSNKTAKLAIETFRDELLWYFTEYKDSL